MTKISDGLYNCGWCDHTFKANPERYTSPQDPTNPLNNVKGKQNVTNALRCPNCRALVSQKTKLENIKKL